MPERESFEVPDGWSLDHLEDGTPHPWHCQTKRHVAVPTAFGLMVTCGCGARWTISYPQENPPESGVDPYAAEMPPSACGTFKDIPDVPCFCGKTTAFSKSYRVHLRYGCYRTIEDWKAAKERAKGPSYTPTPTSPTNPDASGTQGDVGVGLAFTSALSITAQPPLPDCPSCGRKRKMGEKVTVTANNGTTTLWEGCWGCVVDRLTFDIGRVSLLEAEVRALKEGR